MSNFEYLFWFFPFRLPAENNNKYSIFKIRYIQIDELPRAEVAHIYLSQTLMISLFQSVFHSRNQFLIRFCEKKGITKYVLLRFWYLYVCLFSGMNLDLFFEIFFRIDEIILMRENPTQKRYFYHICKYPKKSFPTS